MDGKGQIFGDLGKLSYGCHFAIAARELANMIVTRHKAFASFKRYLTGDANGFQWCDCVMYSCRQIQRVILGSFVGPPGLAYDNAAVGFLVPAWHDFKPFEPLQRVAFAGIIEPLVMRDVFRCICHGDVPS